MKFTGADLVPDYVFYTGTSRQKETELMTERQEVDMDKPDLLGDG